MRQVYSCWGTFKAFCKVKKEDACFAAGVKCEGHWLYIKPVCNAKIAVRPCAPHATASLCMPLSLCGGKLDNN